MTTSQTFFTSLRNELIALLLFVGLWSFAALFYPVYIIPSPMAVAASYPTFLPQGFSHHLAVSGFRILIGFGLSLSIGVLLGILVFTQKWAQTVNALMSALNVLPGMVLGVIFLLIFGIGDATPIALVAFLTLPTIAINTVNGLSKRDTALEQYLTSIGAQKIHFIRYLYLPALVPTLLSSLSIGMGLAIKVVLMGEFIGSQDGLGYLLNAARMTFDMKEVFFYLALLLLFTLIFQAGLSLLSSSILRRYLYS